MKSEEAMFSIHYNEHGEPIGVTSERGLEVTDTESHSLPENVELHRAVNTTILIGRHNPFCRYIWIPGRGWVFVCG